MVWCDLTQLIRTGCLHPSPCGIAGAVGLAVRSHYGPPTAERVCRGSPLATLEHWGQVVMAQHVPGWRRRLRC